MAQRFEHVIFDFDGTIVDSAPAILDCFERTLAKHGIAPKVPFASSLIGPPLIQTLALLSGTTCKETLQQLAADFKQQYDLTGVTHTLAYPGIANALEKLRATGHTLHIATNKRILPTRLILEHLGMTGHFASVYAIDLQNPPYPSKAAMIAHQLAEQAIDIAQTCYIGDKREDGESAEANHLSFFIANWGYGEWRPGTFPAHWQLIDTTVQISSALQ